MDNDIRYFEVVGVAIVKKKYTWSDVKAVSLTEKNVEQKLTKFEKKYRMSSKDFYVRYNRGELGDDRDFVRWASYYSMAAKAQGTPLPVKV